MRKVLDLGCRNGSLNGELGFPKEMKVSSILFGIDICGNCPKDYDYFNIYDLDFGIPFDSEEFDVVLAKDVLEHLTDNVGFVRDCYRVLKYGGELRIKVPDWLSKNAWEDYTHIRPYTKGAIIKLLRDNGFIIRKVIRAGILPIIGPLSWTIIAEK